MSNAIPTRSTGALLHVTCLPSNEGIGTMNKKAITQWLEFLKASGIRYWQICPIGPTGYGNSPYQCYSAFAGNPLLIDCEQLVAQGLLEEIDIIPIPETSCVEFDDVVIYKRHLLYKAFHSWCRQSRTDEEYCLFYNNNKYWLEAYRLFMALHETFNCPWEEWPVEARTFNSAKNSKWEKELTMKSLFHSFVQFIFDKQWKNVITKAHEYGIEIIGDIPIYVSGNSSDVWQYPELFNLNEQAGVPPDYFSSDGQHWGNPLYDWNKHKETNYAWWAERLKKNFEMCDVLRVDHFRAFDTYWAIPKGCSAKQGTWKQGPGKHFFDCINAMLPNARLVAEDLGDCFPSVGQLRDAIGMPGMAVLHFAFGGDNNNPYLPHNLRENCILYAGTHDNNTTKGWYENDASWQAKQHACSYIGVDGSDMAWDMIKLCYRSKAVLTVIQLQDFLNLGSQARLNTPGTLGNWTWRYRTEQLSSIVGDTTSYLKQLAKETGRA